VDAKETLAELVDRGVELQVVGEAIRYRPREAVTSEVQGSLIANKAELLRMLRWDREVAYRLLKDALAYLNELYVEAADLSVLEEPEDRIEHAFAEGNMFALRAAVREYVKAGLTEFRRQRNQARRTT
jgi:TubC N-terminal docking domain